MTAAIYDDTRCTLGEGPLWHPLRKQLYWFDISKKQLLTRRNAKTEIHQFDENVSAAGWVDRDTLLIASETGLFRFNIDTAKSSLVTALEADNPATRSNDGRADPWGGFWIGTMGKMAEPDAGAIHRFYRGELRQLFSPISISNSICFSPDRKFAYYTDTATAKIMRQTLEPVDGWPTGDPKVFLDLKGEGLNPDGSVVDAAGNLWNAQWGAGRVAQYAPDGRFLTAFRLPAEQTTCPAFIGDKLGDLIVTSAGITLKGADQGKTYVIRGAGTGQSEHQVIL